MFLSNKYTRWYMSIVSRPDTTSTYTERHHIVPRSLGGSNSRDNIVALSARQHFVAHLLLTKMVTGEAKRKMCWALHRMAFSNNGEHERRFTSSEYSMARRIFARFVSNTQKGVPKSELAKQRMKESSKRRWDRVRAGLETHKTTKGYTYKHKKKRKVTGPLSLETRAKMAAVKWMWHPNETPKRVRPEDISEHLSSGWSFGRAAKVRQTGQPR